MTDLDALEAVLAKATPGEWQQGRLLATPETRRFSFEQRADFSDVEKSTIYIGFLVEDEGRSRKCIGSTLGGGNRHSDAAAIVALHNTAPALIAEHRALLAENTALRSALANSPGACVYCQLPANEMNRCASGFPGCGRADDMQGCPHFGSTEIPEDIQEQHVALLARVAELEVVAREFVEAVRLADEIYEPAVDRAYRRAAAALEPKP